MFKDICKWDLLPFIIMAHCIIGKQGINKQLLFAKHWHIVNVHFDIKAHIKKYCSNIG